MKITQKISRATSRYLLKNTVRAKYDRAMDVAATSSLLTMVEIARFPHWDVADIGLTSMFGTAFFGSLGKAIEHRVNMQPIRKRAIQIKKAAKAARKLDKKV